MNNARPSSRIQGLGTFSILTGTSLVVDPKSPPTPAGSLIGAISSENEMAQFVVSNESSVSGGLIIYIAGTDGIPALAVLPQTVVTLETDSIFKVVNNSGGTISCTIGMLLYRRGYGAARGGSGAAGSASGSGGSDYSTNYGANGRRLYAP